MQLSLSFFLKKRRVNSNCVGKLALRAQLIYMGFHFLMDAFLFFFSQRTKKIHVSHASVVFCVGMLKMLAIGHVVLS